MKEQVQSVKEIIENLLGKLTVDAKVEVLESSEGPQFIIRTQEGGLMIGENGKNLISFTHLARKMAEKKTGEIVRFSIDINDYQAKRIEDLKNLARLNAQRVRYFKKEISLKPMSSFERRIIHVALADCPDVVTESQGEGLGRQVVIKPYP